MRLHRLVSIALFIASVSACTSDRVEPSPDDQYEAPASESESEAGFGEGSSSLLAVAPDQSPEQVPKQVPERAREQPYDFEAELAEAYVEASLTTLDVVGRNAAGEEIARVTMSVESPDRIGLRARYEDALLDVEVDVESRKVDQREGSLPGKEAIKRSRLLVDHFDPNGANLNCGGLVARSVDWCVPGQSWCSRRMLDIACYCVVNAHARCRR